MDDYNNWRVEFDDKTIWRKIQIMIEGRISCSEIGTLESLKCEYVNSMRLQYFFTFLILSLILIIIIKIVAKVIWKVSTDATEILMEILYIGSRQDESV